VLLWVLEHQTLPARLLESQGKAVIVVHPADVVAIVELSQILIEVVLANMVIDAIDAALKRCEVAFHGVGRDDYAIFVPNVFLDRVVDLAVLVSLRRGAR
jgi:hypothetical protein